jgi:hypothetical protein
VQASRFSLKTGGDCLSVVWPQNHYDDFFIWASKPRSTVWWFGSQNHHDSFLVWASKLSGRRFVGLHRKTNERMKTVWEHALTSGGLLRCEASRTRVSQFCLTTGGGAMAGGARTIIAEVAWKWSKIRSVWWRQVWHSGSQDQTTSLDIIFSSAHRGILVICFCYKWNHRVVVGGTPQSPLGFRILFC